MNLLLYFVSFGSVFAFFASVIMGSLWLLTKFIQAWGRFFRALLGAPDLSARRSNIPLGLHPLHLKRAGQ
jgi:hypothetical protein